MRKFGKKLIAAAEEAVAWSRWEIALEVVEYEGRPVSRRMVRVKRRDRRIVSTKSCGCIFCDIGLVPVNGIHDEGNGSHSCGLAANDNQKEG